MQKYFWRSVVIVVIVVVVSIATTIVSTILVVGDQGLATIYHGLSSADNGVECVFVVFVELDC